MQDTDLNHDPVMIPDLYFFDGDSSWLTDEEK
jgi:hypothetical protein